MKFSFGKSKLKEPTKTILFVCVENAGRSIVSMRLGIAGYGPSQTGGAIEAHQLVAVAGRGVVGAQIVQALGDEAGFLLALAPCRLGGYLAGLQRAGG